MSDPDYMKEIQAFFSNQRDHFSLFEELERMISSIGPATVKLQNHEIAFSTKTKFAWLKYPTISATRPPNSIVLAFYVGRRLKNGRFVEIVEEYPGRYIHQVILKSKADLDKEVFTWMCEAFTYSHIRTRKATAV